MTRILARLAAVALPLAGAWASPTTPITAELIADGFVLPLYVTHAPDDQGRIFVVEQRDGTTGRIRIVDLETGAVLPEPFLEVDPVATLHEQGLVGLAFHPAYETNGYFYVNYADEGGTTIVARYRVREDDPDRADPGSFHLVMRIPQPGPIHQAGWMQFGPNDGYLYIASGDGQAGGDPGNNAQTLEANLLGKILRIDVDADDFPDDPLRNYAIPPDNPFVGDSGADEIWSYGLRNPWRNAFDRLTGDLWISDVGESTMEEINYQPASSTGGENYGWRCYEGTQPFRIDRPCPDPSELAFPVHAYFRGGSPFRCAVTGGEVYRGCRIPAIQGRYFFADFCSNEVMSLRIENGAAVDKRNHTVELARSGLGPITNITSFGLDAAGEIYIVSRAGRILRIVPTSSPRECPEEPCGPADLAEPFGVLDVFDVIAYLDLFEQEDPRTDLAEPFGIFDVFDVLEFLAVFEQGCP